MNKNSMLKWANRLSCLIIIIFLISACQSKNNSDTSQAKITNAPIDQGSLITVVAIALVPNKTTITQEDVLNGRAGILLFDSVGTDLEQSETVHLHYFSRPRILDLFNTRQGTSINFSDPVFSHLKLIVFYGYGKERELVTAYDVGIRAIFLGKTEIEHSVNPLKDVAVLKADKVLMVDDTTRAVANVQIEPQYLKNTENIDKFLVTLPTN